MKEHKRDELINIPMLLIGFAIGIVSTTIIIIVVVTYTIRQSKVDHSRDLRTVRETLRDLR